MIAHENTKRNRISGNFIGLDSLGSAAVANGASGVRIGGGASENIVGTVESSLADSVWKNRIAGNEEYGVHIINSTGNSVAGNDIGFRIDANADLPNKLGGIYLDGASDNQLGGNGPGQGNRIAGNGAYGIALVDDSNGNVVTGNSIGLSRQMRLDNQFGAVSIVNSSGNQIGVKGEAKNRIVSNAVDVGVHVTGTDSDANTIINNDFEGISLPIDLGADGPTLNDDGDVDVGPNGLQNFPVVQQAGSDSEGSEVAGRLDAEPNATFEIEVFYQNASGGQTVVGYTEVATDSSGYGFWVLGTDAGIPAGARVSATAHKSGVTTSEWSLPTETVGRLDVQSASSEVNEGGGPVQFTIVRQMGLSGRIAVSLEASHPSQVGLPDEVVLPEGQDSVHFDVQIIDDDSVELPIDVTILARADLGAAQFVGMAQVQIIDDDLAWHNVMEPLDVNGDSFIVPTDALLIVNYINGENPADVTGIEPPRPDYYLDTNGDGFVTPSDVLLVINHLNSGSGEGERDSSEEVVDSALGAIDWFAIEQELKKKLTSAAT